MSGERRVGGRRGGEVKMKMLPGREMRTT